jgi:hypothetical protein
MSVFSPLDPRGPDQRRKQLVAKLAQQAGAAHAASARTPMPGRLAGPLMSEGRAFRGAGDVRLGGKANVTQAPNILQSVLARLGVVGKSHAEEMSAGHGLPIAPPVPQTGMPIPPAGAAIPTPGGPAPAPDASGSTPQPGANPHESANRAAGVGRERHPGLRRRSEPRGPRLPHDE